VGKEEEGELIAEQGENGQDKAGVKDESSEWVE
jgi:hypothetical protein